MPEPAGDLEPPGAKRQQADAGDPVGNGMDLYGVAQQDQHAEDEGGNPDCLRESIRRHSWIAYFSKKRLTFSAPMVVGQMVSRPSSAYKSARAGS